MSRSRGNDYVAHSVISDVRSFMEETLDHLVDDDDFYQFLQRNDWTVGSVALLVREAWYDFSEQALTEDLLTPDELLIVTSPKKFADWIAHHPNLYLWEARAEEAKRSTDVDAAILQLEDMSDGIIEQIAEQINETFLEGNESFIDSMGPYHVPVGKKRHLNRKYFPDA